MNRVDNEAPARTGPLRKLSHQDLAAALVCLVVALAGAWLTLGLPIGTARRMGPGYMPMGSFMLLGVLGLAILVGSVLGAHDRISKWYWREIALISGALTAFGLLLERAGLMVAIVVTISIAMLAERPPKPLRILFITPILVGLCYAIFIWGLDIRVPVWPWSH